MAHFARIENGVVTQVLVASPDFIASFGGKWVRTSYVGEYRGNFAGVGYIYDEVHDVFYPPCPCEGAVLNTETWKWDVPVSLDESGGNVYMAPACPLEDLGNIAGG